MSYLPLLDPIFTGNPQVPTAAFGENDLTAASTGFVHTNFVSLTGTQSISGAKTFNTNPVTISTAGSGALALTSETGGITFGTSDPITLAKSAANILSLGAGDKLQQNAAPTDGDDLTNKTYVDALANGLDWKASVRVATAAALPAYARVGNVITASANGALAAVDGVTLVNGNRLLIKNGAAGSDNGLYEVTDIGGAGPFILTRTSDADASAEVSSGLAVFVSEGTANAGEGWVLSTADPITLNTTALTFVQFSTASVVSNLDDLGDVDTSGVVDGSLLRYESTGTVWEDTAALLFSDAGQLIASTTGASAGILLGGDAQWYRSAADVMRTPDALVVDGISTLTGAVTASNGLTATTGGLTATAGDITATAGNIAATVGTLSIGSTSTLTGLVTATGGITTATGSYTTTSSGGFTASGTGTMSTNSGNISSSSGNLVVTAGTSTLGGKVTMSAGQKVFYGSVKTANYTAVLATDYIIPVNSSGGTFTISLPAGHTSGDTLVIKDVTGSVSTNTVTIDPNAAELIDGSAGFDMTVNYQAITLVSNGTNWFVI